MKTEMATANHDHSEAARMSEVCAFLAQTLASPPDRDTAQSFFAMAGAAGIPCSTSNPETTLERDYLDLFVIPNPRYVAPYESYYRDQWEIPAALQPGSNSPGDVQAVRGLLMGESTLKVRRKQLEAGIEPQKDLPDHIANELWFLAHLWKKEADAQEDERQEWVNRRLSFTREHLQAWIEKLAARVRQHEQAGFYGAVLEMAVSVSYMD